MPILNLFDKPILLLSLIIALVAALTVHEAAHAYVAKILGDRTAEDQGRLTLNPLSHLDPIGSLMLIIVGFGWGKPVPINPNHFKHPARDEALVALAGPLSNLLLALSVGVFYAFTKGAASASLQSLMITIGFYNIIIMLFNLLPIPPLDGSKIALMVLPKSFSELLEQYGFYILLAMIFLPIGGKTIIGTLIQYPAVMITYTLFGNLP